MTVKTFALLLAAVAVTATSLPASAEKIRNRPHNGFAQVDSSTGDEIFNDGVDDGKVCAVKPTSVWNVQKQAFVTTMKEVKCNYK